MSHNPDKSIMCPNCGYTAHYNYCARCGQETHLHADTFWGLVQHFIGHYFHYDSKFWQTIKTLVFKPGKLTKAYLDGQRVRYIPPISLYIFISAVYFLIGALTHKTDIFYINPNEKHAVHFHTGNTQTTDTTRTTSNFEFSVSKPNTQKGIWSYLDRKMDALDQKHEGNTSEYLAETINHSLPKIFFFIIPLIGFLLQLLFIRQHRPFANHAIFTLHFQSFTFLLFFLDYIPFPHSWPVNGILGIITIIYLCLALHVTYKISWLKASIYSMLLIITYGLFMIIGVMITFLLIIMMA
ncbi:DUF3667 domain-containing protein [Chitinophagaceae bacterium MMS25-I14]